MIKILGNKAVWNVIHLACHKPVSKELVKSVKRILVGFFGPYLLWAIL